MKVMQNGGHYYVYMSERERILMSNWRNEQPVNPVIEEQSGKSTGSTLKVVFNVDYRISEEKYVNRESARI